MVAIIGGKGIGLERSSAWVLGSQGQLGEAPLGRGEDNVYVNAATGNLVITRRDEFLIGRGPDVSIDRTYNSQTVAGLTDGDNNDQWRMGVYRKVTGLSGTYGGAGTTVKRIDWDGSDTLYTWSSADAAYVATDGAGAYDKLTRASGVWTWTDGDTQIAETYADGSGGRITARTDTDGNGIAYTYNGAGLITRVTNANGAYADEYTELVYGGTGGTQLLKLETHAGGTLTRVFYTYDAYNRLSQVKVNLDPTDNSDATGANYVYTYTYTNTTDKRIASIGQSDGSLINIAYVQVGSVYKVSTLTQTVAWGGTRQTTFTYQSDSTIVTDNLGQQTRLYYDANQNLTKIIHPSDPAGNPRFQFFDYTWTGDLQAVTFGPSDKIDYLYDARGNRLSEQDTAGNSVIRTYNSKNQVLTERSYVNAFTTTGETGTPMTTRYAYDTLGHLRYVVSPEGFVTEYQYETNPANLGYGQQIASIDYAGNAYNVAGLAFDASIAESALNSWAAGISDKSTARRTQTAYDYRGNISTVKSYSKLLTSGAFDTSSELSQTTYVYDQAGNLLSKLINGSSATETFIHDGLNRMISSTDFNNVTTTVAFNDASRTTVVSLANGLIQTSLYGNNGELLSYTESGAGVTSVTDRFYYDSLGRLRATADALWQPDVFYYDAIGQKTASIDSDGTLTEYRYDAHGNLTSTVVYATRLSEQWVYSLFDESEAYVLDDFRPPAHADDRWNWYAYDGAQRLIQTIDGTGATTVYTYDAASRLISTKQYANRLSASVLANLKTNTGVENILLMEDDTYWSAPGLTVTEVGEIDGAIAYKFTGVSWNHDITTLEEIYGYAGDVLTMTVSMQAVGSIDVYDFGNWTDWESPYEWGHEQAVILSGPGTLTKTPSGRYRITGLSNSQPTRIMMMQTFTGDLAIRPHFYIREWNAHSQGVQHVTHGESLILAGPVMTRSRAPGVGSLPASDAANDRVTRNFYDRDDRLIGTLDAEGYLTQIVYDKAGLKTKTIAYSGATGTSYRATGTFAQLLGSITVDNASDIHTYCVYDARGFLRAEIDGEGNLTRYAYTPLGDLSEVVTGQKLDPAALLTTPPTFANLPAAASGTVLQTTAYTRNHYGQALTETKSLTGGTSTLTTYTYDSGRRLVSTTTQSGGPDARIESRRYDMRGRLVRELSGIGSALLAALGPNPDEELSEPIWTEYGTLYGYDDADRLIARTDANGARTLYYYDADDRLAFEVDATGSVIEYRYDAFGGRTDTILYAARFDTETFVEMTGGAAVDIAGDVAALASLALDQRSIAIFDVAGRIRASRDPLGSVTIYDYNSFGDLVSTTVPLESGLAAPSIVTPDFSFELPETGSGTTHNPTVSGVTFSTRSGVTGNGSTLNFVAAPDGDQVGFIQSNSGGVGSITMTVTGLNAGTVYNLSYMLAKSGSAPATGIRVSIDGQIYSYWTPGSTSFTQNNIGFMATASTATIVFDGTYSTTENRTALDKVIVTQVSSVPHSSFEVPEVGSGSVYNPSIGMVTFQSKAGVAGNGSSWGFAAAPDGDQVAFLQSNSGGTGSISETLTNLIPGRSYQVSFYLAKRSSSNANPVTVSIDGNVLGTFTPSSTGFVQFTTSAFQVTGTSAVLTFSGAASATEQVTALDKVVVTQLASNNLRTNFSYDRRGLLKTEIVDSAAGGKAITTSYGYDAFGRAVLLTDPNSDDTTIVYDRAGRVVSTTDALDNGTFFTYDARGNLVAVKDALDHVTRYVYDSGGRRIFAVDALGGVVATSYDGDGRVLATRAYSDSISLDGLGLQIAAADVTVQLTTSPGDRITRNAYDKDGRLKFAVDGAGGLTEYRYDDAGNAVRTIRYDWTVSPASTYTVEDLQAEVDTHASDPMRITRAVYDAAGRMTFEIDPTGNVTAFTYDSAGRVIKQVAFATTYDISNDPLNDVMQGWALANEQSDDRVSRAIYDRKGRLVYSVDAEGFVTEYRYNKLDSIVKEIRYATPYTVGDGATVAGLAQQIGSLPASAIVTDIVYDSAGRLAETVDGLGHRTVMTLDQRGQILSTTVAYGTGDAATTTRSYDALGRLLTETRADGTSAETTTVYGYNALGDVVSVTRAQGTGAEWTTLRRYDALGRLHSELSGIGSAMILALGPHPDQEVVDPIWAEYAAFYGYDEAGRLTSTSDAIGARTMFYYDRADRLVYQVDELGAVVEYRYNALGDRTDTILYAARINNETLWELVGGDASDADSIVAALANAALDEKTSATHDSAGRTIQQTDALGALTGFAYNAFGELKLKTDPLSAGTVIKTSLDYDRRGLLTSQIVDSAAGGKAITTGYEYDAFGRATTVTDPNSYVTASEYDKDGRVILARDAFDEPTYFSYDARGNLVAVTDALGHITRYVYDAADRRIFAVDALGGVVETSYDGAGRVVATRAYADEISLDGFGLQISASAVTGRLTTDAGDRITRNAYDKDGRLRFTVDGVSALTEYRYDDVGNAVRTIRHSWTVSPASTYTLDDLQAQVDAHAAVPGRIMRSVYDAAGRMTFTIDPTGNVTAFTYNSAGRIVRQVDFVTAYETDNDPLNDVMQGWAAGSAHSDDRVTRVVYDRKGQPAYSIDAEGFVTEYRFNKAGNVTLQINYADRYPIADDATPASVAALLPGTIPQSAEITEFQYDSAGRLEETRDGLNIRTRMELDQRGQVLSTTVAYGTGDAATTTRSYDALGRLFTETRADGTLAETTTIYGYNALGDVVSVTRAAGTTAEATTLRRYDALGRLHSEMSGIGSAMVAALGPNPDQELVDPIWAEYATFYGYDEAGRLTSTSNAVGARTMFYYDRADRLVYQVDELGAVVEYRYDGLGERSETIAYAARINNETLWEMTGGKASDADSIVTALADAPLDEKTVAIYDAAGRLTRISGPLGAYSAYSYDSFGAVKLRSVALGESATPGVATEIQTSFVYDRRGLLTSQVVDSAVGGKAITTGYKYDALDRVFETTDANNHVAESAYDRGGRVKSRTDALDNTTDYAYDARGNLVAVTDALDRVTRFVYDNADRLIFTVDALGGVVQTSYDGDGRPVATRAYAGAISVGSFGLQISAGDVTGQLGSGSPDDRITRNAYDKDGRLRFTVDGAGALVEYRYDDVGNAVRTIRYGWTVSPASTYTVEDLQAQVDAHAADPSRISRAVYDAAGRMTFAIDATNRVTAFSYDSMGRVIKQVVYATAYDSVPEPLDWEMQGWVAASAHADDRISRSVYDREGRLAYSVDAENYVTEYRYNRLGELILHIRYANPYPVEDGATPASMAGLLPASVPQSAATTEYLYDSAGRLEETRDATGTRTVMTLDQLGQIRFSTRAYDTPDAVTTEFTYDALRRVKTETLALGAPEETTTEYLYDALGNLETITYAAGTPDECVTTRIHDALGRLESETRAVGEDEAVTTDYAYNAFGDLEVTTVAPGTADEQVTKRDYDALGRVESETLAFGRPEAATTAYAYNAFGDLARVTDARLNSAYFYYDALGRLELEVDQERFVTKTTYSAFDDQPESVTRYHDPLDSEPSMSARPTVSPDLQHDSTTSFDYDKLGRLTKVTDAMSYYEQYTLDAFGNRIEVRNKLAGVTHNSFDEMGRLESETLPMGAYNAAGTLIAATVTNRFEYDARGNRKKTIEADGLAEQRVTNFVYDKLDRVKEKYGESVRKSQHFEFGVPSETYKYDARGNLIEVTDANDRRTLYYYDHLNRRTAEIDAAGTMSTFGYDRNGNVDRTRVYGTAVTLPGTVGGTPPQTPAGEYRETTYDYDGLNRLVSTTVAGLKTGKFFVDSYTMSTAPVTTTISYLAHGGFIRRTDGNNNPSWTWLDKLGREVAHVDAEQYVTVWTRDAEGNALSELRLANQFEMSPGSDPSPELTPGELIGLTGTNSFEDRFTTFEYDRNGRRLSETRHDVLAYDVVGATGALEAAPTDSTVRYEYNGLGQVTRKIEATARNILDIFAGVHEFTDYEYDQAGRLMTETRPRAKEAGSSDWRYPTTDYRYDGLGNLVMTRQGMEDLRESDRYTRYEYDNAGRLAKTTDAENKVREHFHDLAGNLIAEKWSRTGSLHGNEGVVYSLDALGRVVEQRMYDVEGFSWDPTGHYVATAYNAYGEVSARALNRSIASAQEQFRYDKAGRLAATNSGDGVWRYFLYDGVGNQTLAIETEGDAAGINLVNRSLDDALAVAANAIAGNYTDGLTVTFTAYDKRGLTAQVHQPQRELKLGEPRVDLTVWREYNAFGEVKRERDALNNITEYKYNRMGRTVMVIRPTVLSVTDRGAQSAINPTEEYFYDSAGRLVGSETPSNARTTRLLLWGSGYGDGEAAILWEYHPDTGIQKNSYDILGNLRESTNELNVTTAMQYDRLGRLVRIDHPVGLVEQFSYDELGQRLTHSNSVLGTAETGYDIMGRISRQESAATDGLGDVILFDYSWEDGMTSEVGAYGGFVTVTTYAAGGSITDRADQFGRQLSHNNLSGYNNFTTTYDKSGRRIGRTNGIQQDNFTWLNSGLLGAFSAYDFHALAYETRSATYGYDKNGNKTSERTQRDVNGSVTLIQDATASYDAMNRLTFWSETGNTMTPAASSNYYYDENSNIRHSTHSYGQVISNGATYTKYEEFWFAYDSMNRLVIDEGRLEGVEGGPTTVIVRGATGTQYEYDAAGRRHFAYRGDVGQTAQKETYYYRVDGALEQVWINSTGAAGDGQLKSRLAYDQAGRVYWQADFMIDGQGYQPGFQPPNGTAAYYRGVTYNTKGQILQDITANLVAGGTNKTQTDYEYTGPNGYMLGAATKLTSRAYRNDVLQTTTTTTNMYIWQDAPVLLQASVSTLTGSTTTFANSTYEYSFAGALQQVNVTGQNSRTINYLNDMDGRVIRRDENPIGSVAPVGAVRPHEIFYRFNGREMGYSGNNGSNGQSYQQSITNRTIQPLSNPGPFRFGQTSASEYSDSAQSVSPYTSFDQGAASGQYVARAGETLASVAAALWGDSSLWYKLAEANGLSGPTSSLFEGQRLNVPPGVTKTQHNASTFKPYDADTAFGDTSATPLAPKPKNGNKCGILGTILVIAIAVAITVILKVPVTSMVSGLLGAAGTTTVVGAAGVAVAVPSALATVIGAAATGAIASTVSQGFAVATGIQSKFSWKSVALSALSAGITQGIAGENFVSGLGKFTNFANDFARGAIGNAASQGIGVATGLQKKFDFAGVAAAGVIAGVSGEVTRALTPAPSAEAVQAALAAGAPAPTVTPGFGAVQIGSAAGAIAGAATRSVLSGTSFGDNLIAVLPDVIGSTIGNLAGAAINRGIEAARRREQAAEREAQAAQPRERNILVDGWPELGIPSLREYMRTHNPDGSLIQNPFDILGNEIRYAADDLEASVTAVNMLVEERRRLPPARAAVVPTGPNTFRSKEGVAQFTDDGDMPLWMWSLYDSTHDWAEAREDYIDRFRSPVGVGAQAYATRVQSSARLSAIPYAEGGAYLRLVAAQLSGIAFMFGRYTDLPNHLEVASILAAEAKQLRTDSYAMDYEMGVDPDPGVEPFRPPETTFERLGRNLNEAFSDIGTILSPNLNTSFSERFDALGRTTGRVVRVAAAPLISVSTGVAQLIDADIYNDPELARQGVTNIALGGVEWFGFRFARVPRGSSAALRPAVVPRPISLATNPGRYAVAAPTIARLERAAGSITTRVDAAAARALPGVRAAAPSVTVQRAGTAAVDSSLVRVGSAGSPALGQTTAMSQLAAVRAATPAATPTVAGAAARSSLPAAAAPAPRLVDITSIPRVGPTQIRSARTTAPVYIAPPRASAGGASTSPILRPTSSTIGTRAPFSRERTLRGFQDHHIVSDKNPLTRNHELLDLAGFNLQSRTNKIFLPNAAELHATRSIHLGRHTNSVSENLARQMDAVVVAGRQANFTQQQFRGALDAIIAKERALLRSGERALNRNARPWGQ